MLLKEMNLKEKNPNEKKFEKWKEISVRFIKKSESGKAVMVGLSEDVTTYVPLGMYDEKKRVIKCPNDFEITLYHHPSKNSQIVKYCELVKELNEN